MATYASSSIFGGIFTVEAGSAKQYWLSPPQGACEPMVVLLGQKRWLPLEHSLQASDDEDQNGNAFTTGLEVRFIRHDENVGMNPTVSPFEKPLTLAPTLSTTPTAGSTCRQTR